MSKAKKPGSEELEKEPLGAEKPQRDDLEAASSRADEEVQSIADDEKSSSEQSLDSVAALEAATEEIASLKDSFLRAKAEQDNIRRRSEKEVANSRKFAVENFAKEMLNIRDSLKMACAQEPSKDTEEDIKSVHEGITITLKQLDAAFAKFALVCVSPEVGDKLDLNLHQAMSLIESDDIESGCIIDLIQDGFILHDRLLRPAMVVVAK